MRWLDPYIVNRISKKNFEGEDQQDVQSDIENEGDFPGQEGLQKNEEDELLQDNLNDESGTKITPRESKKRKEMSSKEEKQETKFLKVATQKFHKRRVRRRSARKSDRKKIRKVTKAVENYV